MKGTPAFQLYPSDLLTDEHVVLMTNQEVGCYVKLMCYCWIEGSIPAETKKIARLCGEDSQAMATLWPSLRVCFTDHPNIDGRLIHPRLEKEKKKQEKRRLEMQIAGKKGANVRWNNNLEGYSQAIATLSPPYSQAIATPMAKNSSSSSSSSSSNKKNSKRDKEKNVGQSFEEWVIYTKEAMENLLNDEEWLNQAKKDYPTLNVRRTIEKSFQDFYMKKEGWRLRKGSSECNWKSAMNYQFGPKGPNRVFETKSKKFSIDEWAKDD